MLHFDAISQVLKLIQIYDISKLELFYESKIFSNESMIPTNFTIKKIFGPTKIGSFQKNQNGIFYWIDYPGLSFCFAFKKEEEIEKIYQENQEFDENVILQNAYICRVTVFKGNNLKSIEIPKCPNDEFYFEQIECIPKVGIRFTKRDFSLNFYRSVQDVIFYLGLPDNTFEKEEDKMKIHARTFEGLACFDYFFNYNKLGISFLFDITKNTIKKFILHTNSPNYEKFGLFAKCNFKLVLNNGYSCNADTLFPEIQKKLKNDSSPILNFETRFFGFPEEQIIFEVMKNDHIATLTICKFESNPKKNISSTKEEEKIPITIPKTTTTTTTNNTNVEPPSMEKKN